MARIGILGFPNAGKTTLFNALTGLGAATAAHPFSTTEPNVGVAKVPDAQLDAVADVEGSAKTVYATLDLLDLPSMAKSGEGLGAQFIGRLREMDALAVVLRAFEDESVPTDVGATDPVAQAEELLVELTLADFEVFDRRKDRIAKEATADALKKGAADAIAKATAVLQDGTPLRAHAWTGEQKQAFRDLAPLTLKPGIWVVNVGEDDDPADAVSAVRSVVPDGDTVVALSARIEEEAAELSPEDREELFADLGLGEGALATMVRAAHEALGLISFYTVGPKEAHAWTVEAGSRAPVAAGKIHSDLQRGFIRAEVVPIGTVIEDGGWDQSKKIGHLRVEGKDYVVREGDAILVRFSV
ncbi:MAG: redox-regulated ATPase YchF [Acidimicrobiia bacterium]|nr:redox-regulated ATPase YchF [Acidimicrobiia bacterium]